VLIMDARIPSLVRRRGARLAAAVAVAGTAITLGLPGGASPGEAADRFLAGGPVTERTPILGDRAAAALTRAAAVRSRAGLPEPAASRVERVVDRFAGTTYDEVTASDVSGRALHLERFDAAGRLVGAVAFGWQAAGGAPLADAAAAQSRGARLAADLGVAVGAGPDVRGAPDGSGWTLTWPRVVEGVPVPGDGVRLSLWPDGRLHAVVRTERPLAPRPSSTLDEPTARERAAALLSSLFGTRSDRLGVSSVGLGWVAPNSAFDPTEPDAPGATLRLAWVVEARTSGDLADGLRAVKLYLDAGTGGLIGGDVLR
jgi:hypothetical protein